MEEILPKLDLNVTNNCNFRCIHCAFDSGCTKMNELSTEKIREILVQTKNLGGQKIDITGGEATMRYDLDEIVAIGKNLDYKIELVTNGSLLNEQKLQRLEKLGLDAIAISLDGSSYETYATIRRTSRKVYERVLQNIKLAVQGFNVKINTLASQQNYWGIPRITQFCIDNKIREQGIYYFTPIGRGARDGCTPVEPIKWLEFIRNRIAEYDGQIKLSIEVPLIEKGRLAKEKRCIAESEKYHLQILPDGNVYPCAIMASYEKPIANLNLVSVPDIWQNKNLWSKYWLGTSQIFEQFGGCVNLGCANFNVRDTGSEFEFVCPLRKFSIGDLA